jgi:hypothetical protein
MLTVRCIDASSKPNEIPSSQWVVKDTEYTLIALCKSKMTGDLYYKLEEIQPPLPYGGYRSSRFALMVPDLEADFIEIELEVEEIL